MNWMSKYTKVPREALWETLFRLVMLLRGARFLDKCGATAVTFPTFSDEEEEEACRFAKDDDVDDENDERRFWVDILNQTHFTISDQETN